MRKTVPVFLLISALVAACATGGGRPDWIAGDSADYPPSRYLTATGSASNPEDAKTRALANLAKIFEVRVEETSRDESSAWQQSGEAGTVQGGSQLTARYIDAYSTKLLEGADTVAGWHDTESKRYYALAVISRGQLGTRLRGDINAADRYVQQRMNNARLLQDPVARAQMIFSAGSALRTREMLQKDLQIVDRTGTGVPASWTGKMLQARLDAALSKVSVRVQASPDSPVDLEALLRAAVTAAGMRYAPDAAAYELQGTVDVQDVGWRDGWYWYRGSLQVSLNRIADGKVSAAAHWPLKSSGQSQQQSRIRLHDQIADFLNRALRPALLAYQSEKEN